MARVVVYADWLEQGWGGCSELTRASCPFDVQTRLFRSPHSTTQPNPLLVPACLLSSVLPPFSCSRTLCIALPSSPLHFSCLHSFLDLRCALLYYCIVSCLSLRSSSPCITILLRTT